jgi:hypothetical protein
MIRPEPGVLAVAFCGVAALRACRRVEFVFSPAKPPTPGVLSAFHDGATPVASFHFIFSFKLPYRGTLTLHVESSIMGGSIISQRHLVAKKIRRFERFSEGSTPRRSLLHTVFCLLTSDQTIAHNYCHFVTGALL